MSEKNRLEIVTEKLLNKPVIVAVVLSAAVVSGVAGFYENITTLFEAVFGGKDAEEESALAVESLTLGNTIWPLEGHDTLMREGLPPLLTGGFKVRFNLSHGKQNTHSVVLTEIRPSVKLVAEGAAALPGYRVDATKLPPQGFLTPRQFLLAVDGPKVQEIHWIQDSAAAPRPAEARNLLATRPPTVLQLDAAGDDVAVLDGTVRAFSPGLYEVHFLFVYTISGKRRERATEPIRFVYNE